MCECGAVPTPSAFHVRNAYYIVIIIIGVLHMYEWSAAAARHCLTRTHGDSPPH